MVPKEFKELIALPSVLEAVKLYSRSEKRVDHFWRDIVRDKYQNFMKIVILISTLYHGNANAERGYSVNSECLFENMREDSIIAKRLVYDHVLNQNGLENYDVPKALVQSARSAHSRWVTALKAKKANKIAEEQKKSKKNTNKLKIKELLSERTQIIETSRKQAMALD